MKKAKIQMALMAVLSLFLTGLLCVAFCSKSQVFLVSVSLFVASTLGVLIVHLVDLLKLSKIKPSTKVLCVIFLLLSFALSCFNKLFSAHLVIFVVTYCALWVAFSVTYSLLFFKVQNKTLKNDNIDIRQVRAQRKERLKKAPQKGISKEQGPKKPEIEPEPKPKEEPKPASKKREIPDLERLASVIKSKCMLLSPIDRPHFEAVIDELIFRFRFTEGLSSRHTEQILEVLDQMGKYIDEVTGESLSIKKSKALSNEIIYILDVRP